MNPERFETLADAFGGDVSRWPAEEREAAAMLMAVQGPWAQMVLMRADEVDRILQASSTPISSPGLADRILAQAPRPTAARWTRFLWPAGFGAGLAAACAAGMVFGAHIATTPVSSEPTDALTIAVAYDDLDLDLEGEIL